MNKKGLKMKPDNPPAFPEVYTNWHNGQHDTYSSGGMTIRDYFAAHALTILSSTDTLIAFTDEKSIAKYCYGIADAMLAERMNNENKG